MKCIIPAAVIICISWLPSIYSTDRFSFDWHDETNSDIAVDNLHHDCLTIRTIDRTNLHNNSILKHLKIKERYVKYNHAYGIPVLGIITFKNESMIRACYLIRYLFAGNEWFRRYAITKKTFAVGDKGGFCCPAQMSNQGLSCSCDQQFGVGGRNNFPLTGQGSPAHELAHWFIKHIMAQMAKDSRLKVPTFQNDSYWSYQHSPRYYPENDIFSDFLWNSYKQDKLRKSTKIRDEKLHHYFIYTGQQNYMIMQGGSGQSRNASRQKLKDNNKNLYEILKSLWQCDNNYIPVCKDAAFDFTKGLAQKMAIGKADPTNPMKMICRHDLDSPQVRAEDVKLIITPTGDLYQTGYETESRQKCIKTIRRGKWKVDTLQEGEVEDSLGNGNDDEGSEYAWFLRKCCANTAKFSFV